MRSMDAEKNNNLPAELLRTVAVMAFLNFCVKQRHIIGGRFRDKFLHYLKAENCAALGAARISSGIFLQAIRKRGKA